MASQGSQVGRGKSIRRLPTTNGTTRLPNSTVSRATTTTTSRQPNSTASRAISNSQLPLRDPQVAPHPATNNLETSSTPVVLRKTRGKTTAKGMIDMITSNGNKRVEVIFDEEHWVPNTQFSNRLFTSGIGILVRNHAPVCNKGWHKIEKEDKETLREGLTVHFDVDIEHPKIIEYVDEKMRSAYTQFKWRLHDHFVKCGTPVRGRATPPPEDLWGTQRSIHDWYWLCDKLYTNPDYIEKCMKNSASRKRQKKTHRGGAMPFIQHALKTAKEGNTLSFIDNWATMYQDSNGNWVSDEARDRYVQLTNKREVHREKLTQQVPEGTPPESVKVTAHEEISIMAETCGRKGKRVRGLGSFPRMESSTATSSKMSSSQMTVMQDKVDKLESSFGALQSENIELKACLKKLMMEKYGHSEDFMMNPRNCSDTENEVDIVPETVQDGEDCANNNEDNSETENCDEDI